MEASALSDEELTCRLKEMAKDERVSLKEFIRHLREFDKRKLAGGTSHATTFIYCRKELMLSESETYRRLQVSGVIERVPELLDFIEDGTLSLTVAGMLAPFVTKANIQDLAAQCRGMTRREAEAVIEGYRASPAARDIVKWMPKRKTDDPPKLENGPTLRFTPEAAASAPAQAGQAGPSPAPPAAGSSGPSDEARLHFNVPRAVLEKLERARGLLRHKFPKGEFGDILDEALEALLDRIERRRRQSDPAKRPVLPGRRYIPEWVKKAVWDRDGGRCAFQTVDGKRCEASEWLEYDHVTPFALGGPSDDPDNVRLLCRAHNQHRAREDFGDPAWTGGTFEPGSGLEPPAS